MGKGQYGMGCDTGIMQWQLDQAYMKGKGKAFSGKGWTGGKGKNGKDKNNKGKNNGKGTDNSKGKGKAEDWWCKEVGCEATSFNLSYRSHCAWCACKKGMSARL